MVVASSVSSRLKVSATRSPSTTNQHPPRSWVFGMQCAVKACNPSTGVAVLKKQTNDLVTCLSNQMSSSRHIYRPQRSCGQGNIFTPVCHSVHRGGGSASMHAGIPTPPDQADPPDQSDPPPGELTPAYGIRAAGTHPTGMHSCRTCY